MNNICEKKWTVAIIAIFSSFVLTIIAVTCIEIFRDKIVLLCQNNIVPADKELGNNYMLSYNMAQRHGRNGNRRIRI